MIMSPGSALYLADGVAVGVVDVVGCFRFSELPSSDELMICWRAIEAVCVSLTASLDDELPSPMISATL
jgi:hypothetical protein